MIINYYYYFCMHVCYILLTKIFCHQYLKIINSAIKQYFWNIILWFIHRINCT